MFTSHDTSCLRQLVSEFVTFCVDLTCITLWQPSIKISREFGDSLERPIE